MADRFPCGPLLLPRGYPLLSVSFIKYTDSDGVVTTWNPANYLVNLDHRPGFVTPIYGGSWPDYTPAPSGSVRIRYTAGRSLSASPLIYPEDEYLQAVRILTGALYENRETEVISDGTISQLALQYGVEAFIAAGQVEYEF